MEVLAVVSGVAIAVAGWIVTQYQARRAVRRNMRIKYLLGAYRRLEQSSNRPMTANEDLAVEAAVADIQLLGSPAQVRLAEDFITTFAANGTADTEPLLQDLRASLRSELLLEAVPPKRLWLRISRTGGTLSDRSRVWHETDETTRRALDVELGGSEIPEDFGQAFPDQMRELAQSASPSAAIEAGIQRVEIDLRSLVEEATSEGLATLNVSQLASRALQLGLIDAQLADAINGLGVMRLMAVMDQDRLDLRQAMEFIALCAGVLYAISRAERSRPNGSRQPNVEAGRPAGTV
ncbi:MAG: hypothetical protein ACYCXA_03510 [Actinomycetes bacterium]